MSHRPVVDCSDGHAFTSWTTAERTNPAGDRCFYFVRRCASCGLVDETSAAIVESQELRYARTQQVNEEPDS